MGMKHDLNINNVTVSRCETVDGNGDITVDATVHVYLDPVIIPKQISFTAEFEDGECVNIKQNEL